MPADKAQRVLAALETQGLKVGGETTSASEETTAGRSLDLELVGLDRPDIVREISQLLASSGANVEKLATDRMSAAMSGEMLFVPRKA